MRLRWWSRGDDPDPRPAPAATATATAQTPPHGEPLAVEPPPGEVQAGGPPLDEPPAAPAGRRRRRVLAIAGGTVVVIAGAYVGAAYALAGQVPRGANVVGVPIGGMSADAAQTALTSGLAARTTAAVPVSAHDQQSTLDPVAAGLSLDAAATVDSVTGVDLADPGRLWRQIVGMGAVQPVTAVDGAKLDTALAALGETFTADPTDATLAFADGQPKVTDAVDGWALDASATRPLLTGGWLTGSRPLELPTTVSRPQITTSQAEQARDQQAKPLVAGAVTVQAGGRAASLAPATLAAAATFTVQDGALVLALDGNALVGAVTTQLPGLLTPAADAHFDLSSGKPVVVAGAAGTTIDPAALARDVVAASTTSARSVTAALVATDPAQSTAALDALGVTAIVSEFSTPLTSETQRTINITKGAQTITGVLVRPGETFSLAASLGAVDAAHGFVQAGAIVNGEHTAAWGGGLSQLSTTTYNAAFFAGFDLVEHKPHSEWFARYPEGREATIFAPQLDMKWRNNSPYGALVQGWVADKRVYVRIWGTKYWTVATTTSPRRNVVPATTVYSTSPTCSASGLGNPGFSVTVTRTTSLNGAVTKNESWSWTYNPQNRVVCGAAPG